MFKVHGDHVFKRDSYYMFINVYYVGLGSKHLGMSNDYHFKSELKFEQASTNETSRKVARASFTTAFGLDWSLGGVSGDLLFEVLIVVFAVGA